MLRTAPRLSGRQLCRVSCPKIENVGSCVAVGAGGKSVAFGVEERRGLVLNRQKSLRVVETFATHGLVRELTGHARFRFWAARL